jgi:hypothetical protein
MGEEEEEKAKIRGNFATGLAQYWANFRFRLSKF